MATMFILSGGLGLPCRIGHAFGISRGPKGSLGILRSSSISLNSINFLRPVSNSISFKFDQFPADAIFKVRAAPSLSSERRSEESIFTHSYAFLLLLRDWRRNLRKLGKSARLQDFFFIDAFKHEIRCPCYCEQTWATYFSLSAQGRNIKAHFISPKAGLRKVSVSENKENSQFSNLELGFIQSLLRICSDAKFLHPFLGSFPF